MSAIGNQAEVHFNTAKEAFIDASQIQYVAKTGDFICEGYEYTGALMETFSGRPLSDRAMRSGSRADIHFREAAVGFGGCDRNRAACFPGHLLGSIGLGSDVW